MQFASKSCPHTTQITFFQNKTVQYSAVIILLLLAFGIRLFHISRPPMDFASIRQYQGAHIARGIYFETNDSVSAEEKNIAKLNMQRMGFVLEPRIIENLAVFGYHIAGKELLWIPRVLSVIFWITGGFFLFLIARMISSYGAALFSLAYYLFLPYSISASRSFQPDPLMLMMLLVSIYTIMVYFEKPSMLRFIVSAIAASLAIYIKPYCLFPIWIVFLFISFSKNGLRKTLLSIPVPAFIFLSFIPAFFQYVYGMLTNTGFLQQHARGSFLPHLILTSALWKGWWAMLGNVTGYIAFILSAIGTITAPKGMPKTLLAGLWLGYFLFGLSATYQIHTHAYYHIPFIPIAALSLGPMGSRAINLFHRSRRLHLPVILIMILVIATAAGAKRPLTHLLSEHKEKMKLTAAILGVNTWFKEFLTGNYENEVKIAKEIGDHVGHSTNTLFLTPDFGRVMAYHGKFAGLPWPTSQSLYARKVRGARTPNIKEDFTPDHVTIGYQGKFIKYTPDFFIITDFVEFEKQSDLRNYLTATFPVLVKNNDYLIFDMRTMSKKK